jgi:hypothetical protein
MMLLMMLLINSSLFLRTLHLIFGSLNTDKGDSNYDADVEPCVRILLQTCFESQYVARSKQEKQLAHLIQQRYTLGMLSPSRNKLSVERTLMVKHIVHIGGVGNLPSELNDLQ